MKRESCVPLTGATCPLLAALPDGSHIVIEARPAEEVTHFRGTRVVDERVQVCCLG